MSSSPKRSTSTPPGLGYGTILVHADRGLSSSHRMEVACGLARSLQAKLIGVSARVIETLPPADPMIGVISEEWIGVAEAQAEQNLREAEAAFNRDAAGADKEWRAISSTASGALIRMARSADLLVMEPSNASNAHMANPAEVVVNAGRPVLMIPRSRLHLQAKAVVVAWRDSRECRRAVTDALPFLRRADDVIVATMCAPTGAASASEEITEVVAWLASQGVAARAEVSTAHSGAIAEGLARIASNSGADLIVAGAYSHSRFAEWLFGGVTADLLQRDDLFLLVSH